MDTCTVTDIVDLLYRPYFTYWVTTVQVIIMIVSLAFYGFAPIGFNYTQKTGLVSTQKDKEW